MWLVWTFQTGGSDTLGAVLYLYDIHPYIWILSILKQGARPNQLCNSYFRIPSQYPPVCLIYFTSEVDQMAIKSAHEIYRLVGWYIQNSQDSHQNWSWDLASISVHIFGNTRRFFLGWSYQKTAKQSVHKFRPDPACRGHFNFIDLFFLVLVRCPASCADIWNIAD